MRPGLDLLALTGRAQAEALLARPGVAGLALEERNATARARGLPEFPNLAAWLSDLRGRTVCLTLLAGSGSRWVKSLEAARSLPEARRPRTFVPGFDPSLPRGLYPVANFLPFRDGQSLPMASYALAAVRGLGRHLLVVRGSEAQIDREVLEPLGIGPEQRDFLTQEAPYGKPLGHGDAAWQSRALWRGADYVVTNFAGDASSRLSVLASLLVLDALSLAGRGPDLLLPAATIASPSYRIDLDAEGLPRRFFHAKLQARAEGAEAAAFEAGPGCTNVGLRLYRAPALLEAAQSFRSSSWIEGTGYAIPGNDPEGHEFALDNVDSWLAASGRARILPLCLPEELCPAKSLEDLEAFEEAMAVVVEGDRGLGL